MKKQFVILLVVVGLVLGGVFLYQQLIRPQLDNRTVTTVAPMKITNEVLGVEFTYPSGENGYSLIEPPIPEGNSDGLQKVYLIMGTQAYIEHQSLVDTETPPSVSVFVFTMPESLPGSEGVDRSAKLLIWAETYARYSSYALRTTEPETVEVDGVRAIRYQTDGLYNQSVYLMSYQGKVYMFTGQYDSVEDEIYQMFNELIASVTFY
jgi:hypothetical protein